MKKVVLAVLALLLIVTPVLAADVRVAEISVQEMLIQRLNEKQIRYTNEWSDETVALQVRLSWYGVFLSIANKTSSIMHLNWDKSAFILTNGQSRRIIPGDTRVIHSEISVPPNTIPPRSSFESLTFVQGFGLPDDDRMNMILDYPVDSFLGRPRDIYSRQSKSYAKFADKYKDQRLTMLLCLNIDEQDLYYQFNLNLDFAEGIKNLPQIDDAGNEIERLSIGWQLEENKVIVVEKNSIAEKVGLLAGDLIKEINLSAVDTVKNIDAYCLEKLEVGSSVMLLCDRNGESVLITLKKYYKKDF